MMHNGHRNCLESPPQQKDSSKLVNLKRQIRPHCLGYLSIIGRGLLAFTANEIDLFDELKSLN